MQESRYLSCRRGAGSYLIDTVEVKVLYVFGLLFLAMSLLFPMSDTENG